MGKWIDEIDNPQYWREEPKHRINCASLSNVSSTELKKGRR